MASSLFATVTMLTHLAKRRPFTAVRKYATSSTRRAAVTAVDSSAYDGNNVLGIVREDFSIWERRSPSCCRAQQARVPGAGSALQQESVHEQ
jgi:hypothetical protein